MNNILSQIYKNSEATAKAAASTDATMQKLLKLETQEYVKERKEEKTKARDRRREAQLAKRKAGDKKGIFGNLSKKEQKKEKQSLAGALVGALGGLAKGILGALGSLGGIITTALGTAFAGLGIGAMLTKGLAVLGAALIPALKAGLVAAAAVAATKTKNTIQAKARRQGTGFATTAGGVKFDGIDLDELKAKQERHFKNIGEDFREREKEFEAVERAMRDRKSANDRVYQLEEEIKNLQLAEGDNTERIEELKEELDIESQTKERASKRAAHLFKELNISDKELLQHQIDQGRRSYSSIREEVRKNLQLEERDFGVAIWSEWETNKYQDGVTKKQTGGLIPTLLEPGEKVFLPGMWGPEIQGLNDLIPRFQNGGLVQATHAHTGSGWSPGTDAQGRPAVFSKGAAEAWMKMMQDSNGTVTTRSINSSRRSPSWNAHVGGVPNSRHLSGNAADVQTGSATWHWLKANGAKYGWTFNNYMGPQGWHFDYNGSGKNEGLDSAGTEAAAGAGNNGSGNNQGAGGNNQGGGNNPMDALGSEFMKAAGGIGGFALGFMQGFGEMFGGIDIGAALGSAGSLMAGGAGVIAGIGQGILGSIMGNDQQQAAGPGASGGTAVAGAAGTTGDALTMGRNLMRDLGLTKQQAAGIVGNMIAESGVENGRPQNSPPGTKAPLKVDDVTGYGIVQWTSRSRQQALWDYASSKGDDMTKPLSMQTEYEFFLKEIQGRYGGVLAQIRNAKTTKEASTIFMQQYEVPAGYRTNAKIMERYNLSAPIEQQLQRGGITGVKRQTGGLLSLTGDGNYGEHYRLLSASEGYNAAVGMMAQQEPIIIYDEPEGGDTTIVQGSAPNQDVPNLPDGPSTTQAAEYFYNLNFAGNF